MTHDNTQSDVVERLRAYKPYQISDGEPFGPKFCEQAADEIERLRAALASTKDSDGLVGALGDALRLIDRAAGEGLDVCGIDAGDTWDALAKAAGADDVKDEEHFVSAILTALTSSDAVLEERERCARIAEKGEMAPNNGPDDTPVKATRRGIAAAIRKGDNA